MVVLYGCYIGSWLGLITKTVRPYIRPYIDWFEYLKSWLKKATRGTTKHIQSCCIVAWFAAAIYYLIWSPTYVTVHLVRGCIMEFFKPDLQRERERERERDCAENSFGESVHQGGFTAPVGEACPSWQA
jgi:hypothetical protein